jgi:hypothetical protein
MNRIPKKIRKRKRDSASDRVKSSQRQRPSANHPRGRTMARSRKAGRPVRRAHRDASLGLEPPAEASLDTERVKAALDKLARTQTEFAAASLDILNVAHDLGRTAVATFKDELVRSLILDHLLQDLERLRAAAATSTVPPDLQLLPEAVLNWFCRHLDLSQHLERGQELEVPAVQLSQYEILETPPDPMKALVTLRVVTPGWKHSRQTVIFPQVTVRSRTPEIWGAPSVAGE